MAVVFDGELSEGPDDAQSPVDPAVEYVAGLSREALEGLALELAEMSPQAHRLLETRAAVAMGDNDHVSAELVQAVESVTHRRGFIDYRRSFAVAREINDLLDELERLLESGAADLVAPALKKALVATRRLTMAGDDSSGVLGEACSRAALLYARACREGNPDHVALAKWLATFRGESPGWPELPLAEFLPALDDKALKAYRSGVEALVKRLDERHAGAPGPFASGRRRPEVSAFDVQGMLVELADLDGDVDRAVTLLAEGHEGRWGAPDVLRQRHPAWGDIVSRLRLAGRDDDVLAWTERAVNEGGVSADKGNAFWLSPLDVADTYLAHDRRDDALATLRRAFQRRPGRGAFDRLGAFADRLGLGGVERAWAMDEAHRIAQPPGDGSVLVDIALGEGDHDAAWAAADRYGAGMMAERLAVATAGTHPAQAAEVHRTALERDLQHSDTRLYKQVADRLVTLRGLHAAAGTDDEFATLIRDVRDGYRRRPSLMAALNRAGLPS